MLKFLLWLTARLPVHDDGHLYHPDNRLYMGRWIVLNTRWLHVRIHHIATADPDRHMHDHPASFASLVLHGGYDEARPMTIDPHFVGQTEYTYETARRAGSLALRRATDRHQIIWVARDTWSLFIFFGGRHQWWGYYTPEGKVWWKDYLRKFNGPRVA
jgi:hypothetical protein